MPEGTPRLSQFMPGAGNAPAAVSEGTPRLSHFMPDEVNTLSPSSPSRGATPKVVRFAEDVKSPGVLSSSLSNFMPSVPEGTPRLSQFVPNAGDALANRALAGP